MAEITEAQARRCGSCDFWSGFTHGNQQQAECRRRPPVFTTARRSIWPYTGPDDWCGEFVQRAAAEGGSRDDA